MNASCCGIIASDAHLGVRPASGPKMPHCEANHDAPRRASTHSIGLRRDLLALHAGVIPASKVVGIKVGEWQFRRAPSNLDCAWIRTLLFTYIEAFLPRLLLWGGGRIVEGWD